MSLPKSVRTALTVLAAAVAYAIVAVHQPQWSTELESVVLVALTAVGIVPPHVEAK